MENHLSMQRDYERRHERSLRIIAMYQRGEKVSKIAEAYECSHHTVLRLARAAGLKKRSRRLFDDDQRAAIVADVRDGKPYKAIAADHGASEAFVSLLAKEAGCMRYGPRPHKKSPA